MRNTKSRFASEDILAIEELAEQLDEELGLNDLDQAESDDDIVPIEETVTDDDLIAAAEELLEGAELPDEQEIISADDEADEILAEAEELEKQLEEAGEEFAPEEDCPKCGSAECKCASEVAPGIEDEIGDEAHGGDPTVSTIIDNTVDCDTDKEVFGQNTDSEYVAKVVARLDRVASALEKRGMKKMAFRIDQLSDRLEASIQ